MEAPSVALKAAQYRAAKKVPEAAVYTSVGSAEKPTFDAVKLERIKASLQKQGITVQQDADAQACLDFYHAEAAYFPNSPEHPNDAPLLMLRPNPSRAAVIEELLHLGQHRRTGFSPEFASAKFVNEIEAQRTLLALGSKRQWSKTEMDELEDALEYWITENAKRNG